MRNYTLPSHLAAHAKMLDVLLASGWQIERAIHEIVVIHSLTAADKKSLYLYHYYKELNRIEGLIKEYEAEVGGL